MPNPDDTGPPAEPPGDIASLFPVERARLSELLGGLERADWDRPTPCPGWTVLGLCCHLVGDDLSALARHRDRYHGTPGPPDDAGEAGFATWLDDMQAEWVRAARRLSPRVVTDLLAWAGPQVADMVRRQDPRARAGNVSWAGGLVPAWLDQARELAEYWIHRQQLLQALGRPSDLRADLAAPVLDGLRWAYPFRLAEAGAQPGDTVTMAISGPVTATWQLVAAAPGWAFRDEPGPRVVARLDMTTEQAWRLLTNNLPSAQRARLTASGDAAILGILYQTRAIIGTPK